jgi:hypothetical protein
MMTDDPIPRNMSVTLRFLRELSGNSLRGMAEALNETPGRRIAGKNRERVAKFDHDLVEAIENQKRLKMWHLARYGNWCGMPAGAILLFSQFASHLRDGDHDDVVLAKLVAEAVSRVCNYVIDHADRLAAGAPDSSPADKKLNTLVRKCAYRGASDEQKQKDACQLHAVNELLGQYPIEVKKLYREHCSRKFGQGGSADIKA